MPTIGRGGAGNIQTFAYASARISNDLEANQTAADIDSDSATVLPPREEQLYAHTGRGGSGNYYSPRELRENGQFHGAEHSHILGDGTPAPPGSAGGDGARPAPQSQRDTAPTRTYGRGGAGNYMFAVTESAERTAKVREEDEAARRARLQEEIERGVQDTLAVPAKAKLAGA